MKLLKLAKKWRKQASMNGDNIIISLPIFRSNSGRARLLLKGHFAVYTVEDQKRFMVPMCCLEDQVFRQLLEMSEEEFGLPGNGPIRLPCDGLFMEGLVSWIKRREAADRDLIRKALIIASCVGNGGRFEVSCPSPLVTSGDYRRREPTGGQQFMVSSY
ncbi:unnamed protein product [Linum trigynum]